MSGRTPVVVIGEALIDIVRSGQVDRRTVGGSPLNVAVAAARLGCDVTLVTDFGDDDHGAQIEAHLAHSEVEVMSARQNPTSTAEAALQPDGSASYAFSLTWDFAASTARQIVEAAGFVHAGSIALFLDPGAAYVAELIAAASSSVISIDPNIRPALLGEHSRVLQHFERLATEAHVVKLSNDDAVWLYPGLADDQVVDRIHTLGTPLVVLTRGNEGAQLSSRDARVQVLPIPTRVVDTIGAGDSFMGGLIHAMAHAHLTARDLTAGLDARTMQELGAHAARVAAISVSRAGADPPTLADLEHHPNDSHAVDHQPRRKHSS